MPLTYNGVTSGSTPPTHQAGDLLVAFQVGGTATPPGWTVAVSAINSGNGRTVCAAYKFATSSSETLSGFSGTPFTACLSGAKTSNPIGGKAADTTWYNSNYWYIPGISLSKTDGSSIVLGYIYQDLGGFGFYAPGDCTGVGWNPLFLKRNTVSGSAIGFGNGGNWGYSLPQAIQIEILAKPAAGFLAMF